MDRGDFVSHRYEYDDTKMKKYGLVCWKDIDIVYCLTNWTATNERVLWFRRSQGFLIHISRPKVIADYNYNMEGVDLADTRRLYCNSTIMGLHRWWLKLFFIYFELELLMPR